MTERLRVLAQASHDFSASTQHHEELLQTVARRLAEVVGDVCAVLLASDDESELVPAAIHASTDDAAHFAREIFAEPLRFDRHPIARRVHERGEPFVARALDLEQLRANTTPSYFAAVRSIGMHSLMMLPLRVREQGLGALVIGRHLPTSAAFDDADLDLARALAVHASLAIANARSYAAERAAVERYRLMFDSSPQPMFVADAVTHVFSEVNPAALRQYGYTREEFLKLSVQDLWTAEDFERHGAEMSLALPPQASASGRHRMKDGTIRDVEIRTNLLSFDGRPCRLLLVNDVTERLRSEEARVVAEVRFRRLSESGIVGVLLADAAGVVQEANEAFLEIVGYTRDDLAAGRVRSSALTPPDGVEARAVTRSQLEAQGVLQPAERELLRKDGSRVQVLVGATMVDPSISLGIVLDLSEQKRAEAAIRSLQQQREADARALREASLRREADEREIQERQRTGEALTRAKEAAEAATKELEAFSYSVAHDLRAPLRGMNGFAQLLLDTYADNLDAEGQDWLREIVLNAQKMGELIDALLSLARLTRGELRCEPVDLSALARASFQMLAAAEPGRTVELVVEAQLAAELDPTLARVLIDNLLGNAFKFTSKAPSARIELGREGGNGAQSFFMRDNGAGFDMAFADKLFAPFQRLHSLAEFPGTGIGLATVQRIVRRHGGRVWAEGTVNGGATFYFSFPDQIAGVPQG